MKSTIAIAAFLVAGASAAGVGAIVKPYYGTDSRWPSDAISAAGVTPLDAYVGGGSDLGQGAMNGDLGSHPTQQTAPMSRMMNDFNQLCNFGGGTFGSKMTHASGIVLGLDAVEVVASAQSGAAPACNGTADNTGTGLAYRQDWRYVLALVYGGLDISTGITDCDQPARRDLVKNWSNIFQNGCANPVVACSASSFTGGALWHAFRPDDASAISDIFASAIGLVGSPLVSANSGFGATPYCNAINWDTSAANANCALGAHKQWVGPGGVFEADGVHKRPPPGTWGDNPDPGQGALGADVLPTQFQDNDPIRRRCFGTATNVHARSGEEVCNIDGALGLVLPIPSSEFLFDILDPSTGLPLRQYPTNTCNTFAFGKAPLVFTCALRGVGTKHSGECPNGDALIAGGCLVPIDSVNQTSQCVATRATVAALQSRTLGNPDGRIYNVHVRDGTTTEPTIGYAEYPNPALGTTLNFVGGYGRIHEVETIVGSSLAACQYVSATDQIACLTQADPCSIGLSGHGATTFANRAAPGGQTPGAIGDLRVNQIAPSATSIQQLGLAGAYPLAHKVYFNSVVGFGNIGSSNLDELTLAKFLANPAHINPLFAVYSIYSLGPRSPAGSDTPFCEDFNEQLDCHAASNANGCAGNPAGLPTVSTVCGNDSVEAFEECDLGANNGVPKSPFCSVDCRSVPAPSCPNGTVYCAGTNMCVSGTCPP
jgi:hypothetical protein